MNIKFPTSKNHLQKLWIQIIIISMKLIRLIYFWAKKAKYNKYIINHTQINMLIYLNNSFKNGRLILRKQLKKWSIGVINRVASVNHQFSGKKKLHATFPSSKSLNIIYTLPFFISFTKIQHIKPFKL